jgi:hypothetical protein
VVLRDVVFRARRAGWLLLPLLMGCVVPRQMLAGPEDLRDYRAFRVASHEGRRLAAAQRYLARHSQGVWAEEVRVAFDGEEEAWFEAAKSSRTRAREYVVDLPDGPHIDAARSLLVLFDEKVEDMETLTLLAESRRTAAKLDAETARRKHVSDAVLAALAALFDPATFGARLDAPPPRLAAALRGEAPATWDGAARTSHHDDLFFVLPTSDGSQARAVSLSIELVLQKGRVVQGLVAGEDLFVIWSEAMLVRPLDPNVAEDRELAAATVIDVLGGALEATLPASRCAQAPGDGEQLVRACDGWTVSVRMGAESGEADVVDVVGPRRKSK